MNRRQFMLTVGAVGASRLAVADQPQKFHIGMAATTWLQANASEATYWKACQEIASVGFNATEADDTLSDLDVAYADNPSRFQSLSAKYGVGLKGVFYSFALWDRDQMPKEKEKARNICKFLKGIGAGYIATGEGRRQRQGTRVVFESRPQEKAAQQGDEGIDEAVKSLNDLGKLCSEEYGIRIGFHPGRGMNKPMIQKILDGTDSRYVGFCADVGHLTAAGYDAVEAVKTYGSRLVASHWKDYDPNVSFRRADYAKAIHGDFVELGEGKVNFPALVEVFKNSGFDGWVMLELDRPATTPLESARQMKTFVVDKLKLSI